MGLSTSVSGLEEAIKSAFLSMKVAGEQDGSNPERNIDRLASALANAIHAYVMSAEVDITEVNSVVPPGVAVTTAGSPSAQSGATIAPGRSTHVGFGRLL